MGTRVIVYARVSTTRQADHDLSIPDQLAHAERYCAERGYEIVTRYVDPGASARDDNRPEFQRMVADIKAGIVHADLLLVHSLSRFFRDSFGLAFYCRELAKYGVRVISATQELSNDANGSLMRNVLSAFDEYTSLETAKHTLRSMLENARQGYWNGSVAPFGYRTVIVDRHGNQNKRKLAIEPKESEIVKLAFHLYLYGDGKTGALGIKDLTSYLNRNGLRDRSGKPFRIQFVHDLLTRISYTGTHYFNRRDSRTRKPKAREEWVALEVPRLIEPDIFRAVGAQLAARNPKMNPPRITKSNILLTGIARCEHCGAPMRTRTGKSGQYWYYACSRKADFGSTGCSGMSIPMDSLDDLVTDAISERVLEPTRLQAMIGTLLARNGRHQELLRAELRDLFSKQRELNVQVKNLVDIMEQGGLGSVRSVQDRFAKRQEELNEITRLIAIKKRTLETPTVEVTAKTVQAFSTALRGHLHDTANPTFRRAYLRLLLDKVVVGKDAIRISGPKSVLAHQLSTNNALAPSSVPTFVDGWRPRHDSNVRPTD
jgi:site-specific DNA recombinase